MFSERTPHNSDQADSAASQPHIENDPLFDRREVEILAPSGLDIEDTKHILRAVGVGYSIRRTPGDAGVTLLADGAVYGGPGAVDQFLTLRNPE